MKILMRPARMTDAFDELAVVIVEDWTHRIVNPRALSPTVGAKCRGVNRR